MINNPFHLSVWRIAIPLAILATIFAAYHGLLSNLYVWDDLALFVQDGSLREPLSWAALAKPILPGTTYFRPSTLLSFWLEFHIFGTEPAVSHAINLLLHLANVLLVWKISSHFTGQMGTPGKLWRPALAALLYGLHPALIEPVAWVSGRFDLLATTCTLGAIAIGLRPKLRGPQLAGIAVLFLLGLGAKEVAIALPVALIALRSIKREKWLDAHELRNELPLLLSLTVAFTIYFLVRYASLDRTLHVNQVLSRQIPDLLTHTGLVFDTLGAYVGLTLLPFSQISPAHPLVTSSSLQGLVWGPRAALGLLVGGAILIAAWRRSTTGLVLLGSLAAILPVLHIIPLSIGDNQYHERFLTLSLAFSVLAIGATKPQFALQISPRLLRGIGLLLLVAWAALSTASILINVPIWKTDLSLWSWAYKKHPESEYAKLQYLQNTISEGRYDLAKPLFEAELAKGPLEVTVQILYGAYLTDIGEVEEGINFLQGALYSAPPFNKSVTNFDEAGNAPILGKGYLFLARARLQQGNSSAALTASDQALLYFPDSPVMLYVRSNALLGLDRAAESEETFRRALAGFAPSAHPEIMANRNGVIRATCERDTSRKICRDPSLSN